MWPVDICTDWICLSRELYELNHAMIDLCVRLSDYMLVCCDVLVSGTDLDRSKGKEL